MAKLQVTERDGATVVRVEGGLGHAEVLQVERAFREVGHRLGARVVVDLAAVDFLGTAGIAMFLEAAQTLRGAGGRLVIAGARPRIDEVLRRLRMERVMPLSAGVDEAIAALGAGPG